MELIDNGEFFVGKISENVGGISFDNLEMENLSQRNKITFNFHIELEKLPGKELPESNTGNLVNSVVVNENGYYNSAVNHIISDLVENQAINNVLNAFMASKINVAIDQVATKQPGLDDKHIETLKTDLLKELKTSLLNQDMNLYLASMIEKNMNDPLFVSKLQASINYDQFKKSIVQESKLNFSQCINSYLGNKIDFVMQQKKSLLISKIKENYPKIAEDKLNEYLQSRLIEQNEDLKATIAITINGKSTDEIGKLKDEMNDNITDDAKLNKLLNEFLLEQVQNAVKKNGENMTVDEKEIIDNKEDALEIKKNIDVYMEEMIREAIVGSNFKDVENMVLMKSSAGLN